MSKGLTIFSYLYGVVLVLCLLIIFFPTQTGSFGSVVINLTPLLSLILLVWSIVAWTRDHKAAYLGLMFLALLPFLGYVALVAAMMERG